MRLALLILGAMAAWAQGPLRGFPAAQMPAQRQREEQAKSIPSADQLRAYMERMASAPHAAGSPGSKKVAEYALEQFRSFGLDARIEPLEALLPYPTVRVLETTGPTPFRASLAEPVLEADNDTLEQGQLPPFNAYSASGDVTGPLVYANYGTPEDYAQLDGLGVSVKGKIVIVRYGRTWRGLKPKLAQDRGAVGALIYSDPRDDGFYVDNAYPEGPMRPSSGVQRGSVVDMALYTGDPLTPGWASEPGAPRLALEDAPSILKIPVLPISWADARPLLETLQGPLAPENWRGALPITYHLGPSVIQTHLKLDFDWTTKPLYNVVATIPGEGAPDQWIVYGNHHDAWVMGASDPVSGASVLIETARVLGQLVKQGWKPQRTIKLALWDGEEFGLMGSTEWVEKHAEELSRHGSVYLNTDSSGTGLMSISGSWSLEQFLDEVLRDVKDPRGDSILRSMNPAGPNAATLPMGALGSGSDYVGFLHHLGIASLNLGFGAAGGQYHSNYDTVRFYNMFSDGDRRFGVALTQVMTTSILRLADAPVLPFSFEPVAKTISRQTEELLNMAGPGSQLGTQLDFWPVLQAAEGFATVAHAFEVAYGAALQRGPVAAAVNDALEHVEAAFLLDTGLPGRAWYRHPLYAPGLLTGYAPKTLPGIREAIEAKNWAQANSEAVRLAASIRAAAAQIESARQLLETR